ncbi:MAG: DNA-methyltransferase [Methanomassiliicoccales archaeon]
MLTSHRVINGDSSTMDLGDSTVALVVTSPPYPMIEMWDDLFSEDPQVAELLSEGRGEEAFELMHRSLDQVWKECRRVLVDGGMACVNIGDATRRMGGRFRMFPNHVRVARRMGELGMDCLPSIIWRKTSTKPNKFMGSGMLPPNAYVTQEHEPVLLFRKGGARDFGEGERGTRRRSAFFWEERNRWFSDMWTDLVGRAQSLEGDRTRERAAAFPFELAYRLINMFSIQGDLVLDPFWGTGTTSMAAMASTRSSVGYEKDPALLDYFHEAVEEVPRIAEDRNRERLLDHLDFLSRRGGGYPAVHYDFEVHTSQEREILLYRVDSIEETAPGHFQVQHSPLRP